MFKYKIVRLNMPLGDLARGGEFALHTEVVSVISRTINEDMSMDILLLIKA